MSTLTCAVSTLPEGKLLWGGPYRRVKIEEVDIRPSGGNGSKQDPEDPEAWEREIGKAGLGGPVCFRMAASWRGGEWVEEHLC